MQHLKSLAIVFSVCFSAPALAGDFTGTCRYFSGLAFNDLHTREEGTFRTALAAECQVAIVILTDETEPAAAKAAARAYLITLQRYREVLFDMARARYAAGRDVRGTALGRVVVQPVTRSGEILIARVMGLSQERRDWAAWREARVR